MTGFGRGTVSTDQIEVTIELRSVNSRYAEATVRAPRELGPREVEIQNRVRAEVGRGKIGVSIQVDAAGGQLEMQIDENAARSYAAMIERLRFVAGIQQPVQIDHLLSFKEIFVSARAAEVDADVLWSATSEALSQAIAACLSMRLQEGQALSADLDERLAAIERELDQIEREAPERIAAARDALRSRLGELLGDEQRIDNDRLEMEVALLADRLDVNEECVRLRSHLVQFRDAMTGPEPAGRRLNFLAQEINREVNTIASKAGDASIAHRAVSMKEELEKIREQVQNVA